MSMDISRRDMLVGSAVLGVVAAGAAHVAYAKEEPLDVTAFDADPAETYECDFVVAGSGTAGLCAAIRAAELGLSAILVDVNTENGIGGNSRYAVRFPREVPTSCIATLLITTALPATPL